mgnify:CR=1 FL=1
MATAGTRQKQRIIQPSYSRTVDPATASTHSRREIADRDRKIGAALPRRASRKLGAQQELRAAAHCSPRLSRVNDGMCTQQLFRGV